MEDSSRVEEERMTLEEYGKSSSALKDEPLASENSTQGREQG
jgi:hypothetical protein